MRREYTVMILLIGGVVLSLIIFVSKENIRKALFAALVAQLFTWPLGLLLTFWGKIECPVRLFPKAADNSFLHGFILNPAIFAIYYLYYPKQGKLIWRWAYTILIVTIPSFIAIIENKYTDLIKYKDWRELYNWIIGLTVYFIMRKYIDWFFKNAPVLGGARNEA